MPRSQRLRAGGVRPTKACASPLALTAAAQRTHRMAVLTSAAPPPNTARALPSDSRTHTTDARALPFVQICLVCSAQVWSCCACMRYQFSVSNSMWIGLVRACWCFPGTPRR